VAASAEAKVLAEVVVEGSVLVVVPEEGSAVVPGEGLAVVPEVVVAWAEEAVPEEGLAVVTGDAYASSHGQSRLHDRSLCLYV
jgi:archaeosine-15-forming tRNA-guanine transglycosylase